MADARIGKIERSATITRPANTTQYAAGDVIDAAAGAGVVFETCASAAGKGGEIFDAILIDSAAPATKLDAELWLFDTAIGTYDNDNVAFSPTDAEMLRWLGVIQFATGTAFTAGAAANCAYHAARTYLPMHFNTLRADTTYPGGLYGVLVARNTYTPISAEVFTIRLRIQPW
jgi:hypothetical protein